jgi:hypothetical protein
MSKKTQSRAKLWLLVSLASIVSFFLALLLLAYLVLNWIFGGPELSDCSFSARDQVSMISKKTIEDKKYYVYSRLSGFQDKVRILEVYDHEPDFDECNRSAERPLVGEAFFDIGENIEGFICPLEIDPNQSMIRESGTEEHCIQLGGPQKQRPQSN